MATRLSRIDSGTDIYFSLEANENREVNMIRQVDSKTFDRIWKIIEEVGVQERHFNDLQLRVRSMASLWLLSTFGAVGFLATQDLKLDLARELLVSAVAAAGCIGIALLWVIDLLVYHRLLDSCFITGLDLEKKYPWLPPLRINMMKTQSNRGVLFRVVGFYIGPVVLLILLSGGSLTWYFYRNGPAPLCAMSGLLTVAMAMLAMLRMPERTENTSDITRTLRERRK